MPDVILDDDTPSDGWQPPAGFKTGAVPRDYAVDPDEMFAPPSDMPLIPRNEWDARIDEQERLGSSLEHVRLSGDHGQPIRSLDQNGQGYCATADTEILTVNGFIPYPEYNWTDPVGTVNPITHVLEFQRPFQSHVYHYDGPMIYSTNRRLDFGVTPDHQMYVRKWDEARRTLSPTYSFVRAADMGWYSGFLSSPRGQIGTEFVELEVPDDRQYDGDDFFALLGLIISDGYAGGTDNTRNWVSFASFREETRAAVEALAARTGFRELPSRKGVWIRYDAGALAAWLRENAYGKGETGAKAKRIPDVVKLASQRQIKHFLQWFNDRNRDGSQFYSTSKRLIDDLQELHLRIGKRSSIGIRPAKDVPFQGNASGVIHSGACYTLTISQTDRLCIERKKHIETDRYKGLVYCAAVPNHTLITRRNGSILISSNCWAYSVTATVMLARAVALAPHVRLSAHAVACKVKNFRDEGGWCGLSAKFVRENGIPTVGYWLEKSMSRAFDTPETWANAAKHKIDEDWVDLTRPVWGQNLTFDQVATCLLLGIPCALDFNHWSHSVCGLRLVRVEAGSYGIKIWNSWTDSWGDRGMGILRGTKAVPNGAVATRTVRA